MRSLLILSASLAGCLASVIPNERLDVALVKRQNFTASSTSASSSPSSSSSVSASASSSTASSSGSSDGPVVNLGDAGTWRGVLQNNGTVKSWKGIRYAAPPTGNLRFKAPQDLEKQSSDVQDVSDDALRCVQFPYGNYAGNVVGVKLGPGVEDCLRLWIWAPANATSSSKLPVHYYIHGGGLGWSAAPNNDFSDWVAQSQGFVAVNVEYRLGAIGFMASTELAAEGQAANAGLLDMQKGLEWTKQYISQFGGDPDLITISAGGQSTLGLMALYQGANPLFKQAITRSAARPFSINVDETDARNLQYAQLLNCTDLSSPLACMRNATAQQLVDAATSLANNFTLNGTRVDPGGFAGFGFAVDGVTLVDTLTRLWQRGLFAKVPTIATYANDESAVVLSSSPAVQATYAVTANPTVLGAFNLTTEQQNKIVNIYPVLNSTNLPAQPYSTYADWRGVGTFFPSGYEALQQATNVYGESAMMCNDRLVGKAHGDYAGGKQIWAYRFGAPTVATNYSALAPGSFPVAPVRHSADNSYLQNRTAVMTSFELPVALELRAYFLSFMRHGDPNTDKLASAPYWPVYNALGDYVNTPVRLNPSFAFANVSANATAPTGTSVEIAQRPQRDRCDFWLSYDVVHQIKA